MKKLETFCEEFESEQLQLNESSEMFEIGYNDSGIKKMIKKFLNWFVGKSEDRRCNPLDKEYDPRVTDINIDGAHDEGYGSDIQFKEIEELSKFEQLISVSNEKTFPIFSSIFRSKKKKSILNGAKFIVGLGTLETFGQGLPFFIAAYKINKKTFNVFVNECATGYEGFCTDYSFGQPFMNFVRKLILKSKKDINEISITFTQVTENSRWQFSQLMTYCTKDGKFKFADRSERSNSIPDLQGEGLAYRQKTYVKALSV